MGGSVSILTVLVQKEKGVKEGVQEAGSGPEGLD
jgi:hypothetical protein